MATELTWARRTRKIAEENGDPHAATKFFCARRTRKKKKKKKMAFELLSCSRRIMDKKGLNEPQTTIFSPIRSVVS